jgi:hypothetical protein
MMLELMTMEIQESKRLREHYWNNLLLAIANKKCIPLIGDSSLEYFNQINNKEFLTNNELAELWAKDFDYPLEPPYQLPKVAQFLAIKEADETFPKITISNLLKERKISTFDSDKYKSSPHSILADLHLPIYITTNYDLMMEEALKIQGKEPRSEICRWNDELRNVELIPTVFDKKTNYVPKPSTPLVYHFHGSIDFPASIVLTERDFFEFVINTNREKEQDIIPAFLRREIVNSSLLFMGYSLEDIVFRSIFQGALSFMSTAPRNTNNIAVIQLPFNQNDILKKQKVQEYLEKYTAKMFKIVVYWGDTNDFIEELQIKWKTFKNKHQINGH